MTIFNRGVIRQFIHLFILFIFFAGGTVSAAEDQPADTFPLPLFELESVVKTWLADSGHQITSVYHETGRMNITSKKKKAVWKFYLTSRSPLVTAITVDSSQVNQAGADLMKNLKKYVAEYIAPSVSAYKSPAQKVPEQIQSNITSVVCIKAAINGNDFQLSGFIIDPEGYIVCTAHNLSDTQTVRVIFHDRTETTGTIKKISFYYDLALIQVPEKRNTAVSLKQGRNMLEMGERIYSIGCPVNLNGTINAGVVNSSPRRVKNLPLWQVNMEIHPGSSGSPVFDAGGRLVAIIKGRFRGTESVGFLIPYETLVAFLDDQVGL